MVRSWPSTYKLPAIKQPICHEFSGADGARLLSHFVKNLYYLSIHTLFENQIYGESVRKTVHITEFEGKMENGGYEPAEEAFLYPSH